MDVDGATQLFPILDRLIQWVILPLLFVIWNHNKRHDGHDKKFILLEGENNRILTILEERKNQREDDKQVENDSFKALAAAIDKLSDRLDMLFEKAASK